MTIVYPHVAAVKLEVVLPPAGSQANPAEAMVISTMKHGMEAVQRLKTGDPGTGGQHYEAGQHKMEAYNPGAYGMDRPSAIIR